MESHNSPIGEIGKNTSPDYPIALDIVTWKKDYYQVVGTARTQNQKDDLFLVKDLTPESETIRIKGAKFVRTTTQDPPEGYIYRRNEHVKVTGKLIGGKREE